MTSPTSSNSNTPLALAREGRRKVREGERDSGRNGLPWPLTYSLINWLGSEQHETALRTARALLDCPTAFITTTVDVDNTTRDAYPQGTVLCDLVHDCDEPVFVVPDASSDPRFTEDLMVHGYPHARFFAGTPIRVQDHAVGTLIVLDYVARSRPPADLIGSVAMIARFCSQSLELAARTMTAPAERAQIEMIGQRSNVAVLTTSQDGLITGANRAASLLLRERIDSLKTQAIQEYVVGWDTLVNIATQKAASAAADRAKPFLVEVTTRDGAIIPSRASIVCQIEAAAPRYRLVLEELP
ncbi:GAF domain-containing protein [Acuticoccus sp. I52.16.1]|uniref:GAF domain-containing protein n=1 Tax=Acuticoccus sp. I52.16.1 TaxID=2928472 RepID=UPI001FD5CC72|nr:GAF domain-containing protein [Acuticoccus sp. I52.16.1]UOM35716.1 GAF domain-containing protein [Acuticoccus sp. I52.16.1]